MKDRDERALWGVQLWLDSASLAALTDRELLDRFAAGNDHPAQLAFAALVARHGPMVLRACRAVLRDAHSAEDAFQATFLVLARRGGNLWVRESLGPWLHRVATRVSTRLRDTTARRERNEKRAAESRVEALEGGVPEDVGPIIHAEIDRLPDRYRSPVVLCDLEGLTHDEAAARLGCPIGTVKSRLSRAHEWLRARLERRGVLPAAGGLGTVLAEQAASAVPPKLASAAVGIADKFALAASGSSVAGTVPAAVVTLAEREVMTMSLHKLAIRAAVLLVGTLATTGVLVLAADRPAPSPEPAANKVPAVAAAPVPTAKPVPKELASFQGTWVVENVQTDAWPKPIGKDIERKWIIKGNEITWTGLDGKEVKASFTIDPNKVPSQIDLTFLSGPHKGETCPGVYEWVGTDGTALWLCLADPGSKTDRPKDISFASNEGRSWIALSASERKK